MQAPCTSGSFAHRSEAKWCCSLGKFPKMVLGLFRNFSFRAGRKMRACRVWVVRCRAVRAGIVPPFDSMIGDRNEGFRAEVGMYKKAGRLFRCGGCKWAGEWFPRGQCYGPYYTHADYGTTRVIPTVLGARDVCETCPWTVKGNVPDFAFLATARLSVAVLDVVAEGLHVAVTFAGNPDTIRSTVLKAPAGFFTRVMV